MTKKHARWGWFFIAPYIVGFVFLTLIPMVASGYLSFTDYDFYNPPEWIGLKNYIKVVTNPDVWAALRNSFVYAVSTQLIQIVFGLILALALNRKIKGVGFFRTLYFLPVLTPMVAVVFVWTYMYNPSYGIFNQILSWFGLGQLKYTFSGNWFEFVMSVAVMDAWKSVGYTTLYLLAGLQNVNTDLLEAAEIDGAGPVRKFFNITLPMLTPTLYFLMVMGLISGMQAFDAFYTMSKSSATGVKMEVIGTYIYNNAFVFSRVGRSCAIAWVTFVFIALLTWLQKYIERRYVYYA